MKKYVFVVGAGASVEYKLPLGDELRQSIIESMSYQRTNEGGYLPNEFHSQCLASKNIKAWGQDYAREFAAACTDVCNALLFAESIDNLATSHYDAKNIVEVAKLGIANSIIKSEKNSKLYSKATSTGMRSSNPFPGMTIKELSSTWLAGFFRMLVKQANFETMKARLGNIKFISFNYDRCIKHFLYWAIQVYYRVGQQQAHEAMQELEVLHPYGSLGKLPWEVLGQRGLRFGDDSNAQLIIDAAQSIRTFSESSKDGLEHRARDIVTEADIIALVGMNFHEQNLEFIRVDSEASREYTPIVDKKIIGTTYLLFDEEVRHAKSLLWKRFSQESYHLTLSNCTAGEFFRRIERPYAFE